MTKVYCKKCRHLKLVDEEYYCTLIIEKRDNWLEPATVYLDPALKNQHNDCKDFKRKWNKMSHD